ncbi:MAG: nucleotidyltransferase family protein [Nitrososphaerales archaeon]|jgi:molybdenum cofactor cytidylyltransferase
MKTPDSRVACIILAAGMAMRFGSVKQLAKIKGKSLLQRALDAANNSLADYVLLIVGSNSSDILSKVELGRTQVVLNMNFAKGQSTSIRCGVTNLPEDCAGAIVMVADQPFLESTHLNKIIQSFKKGNQSEVVILSHLGEPRNPVLIPKKLFPKLLKLRGDIGAKATVRGYSKLRLVEITDEKTFLDVDTKRAVSELNRLSRK